MIVPVVWVSHDPEGLARGYWDNAGLEAILAQSLWRPANGYDFEHFTLYGRDRAEGKLFVAEGPAILVVPARHHAYPEAVAWLNHVLGHLSAAIVILTGDEEHLFPWRDLKHERLAVWVMTPEPRMHADIPRHRRFGWLFPPFTRPALATRQGFSCAMVRQLDFFLAAQDTHARRHQCFDAVERLLHTQGADGAAEALVRRTPGFTQGTEPDFYTRMLAMAKIAPCPSGPETSDTFRLWEALEAGCIPLADGATPKGPLPGYWPFLLGEDTPFPVIMDWSTVEVVIPHLLSQWPANANRIFAWYQDYRRKLVYRLHDDIRDVLGVAMPQAQAAEDRITVLISTSPIPSHPSTEIIEETVESIRERLGDVEIVIGVDGVRPEQEDMRSAYEEYVRRLLWRCAHGWHNVVPVRLDEWGHQANVTRAMLDLVRTDVVLFVEHDTPLVGTTPFADLADILLDGELANVIRLSAEASVLVPWRHLFPDTNVPVIHGVPLLRTVQWSQRPHLARTDWYRWLIETYFASESRVMVEDTVYGVLHGAWVARGMRGWREWRVWMYAPPGDMKRSTHTNGRGSEPKYEMLWRYPGETPEFAPNPDRDEEPADGPR